MGILYFNLYTIDDRNIELIIKRELLQKISEKISALLQRKKNIAVRVILASYRCQLTLKTSLSYYNKTSNERITEVIKSGEITKEQSEILIKLKPYWSSCMSDIIQWEACEKCIKKISRNILRIVLKVRIITLNTIFPTKRSISEIFRKKNSMYM